MVLRAAHIVLVACYATLPVIMLAVALYLRLRRGRRDWLWGVGLSMVAGSIIGVAVAMVYAWLSAGRLGFAQALLAAYFGTGLIFVLRVFDMGLVSGLGLLLRRDRPGSAPTAPRRAAALVVLGATLRIVILFGIGLPYVMAAVMTYRPRLTPPGPPTDRLRPTPQDVSFTATDGTRLAGWWIPAAPVRSDDAAPATAPRTARTTAPATAPTTQPDATGRTSVILCHGLGASKEAEHTLAAGLRERGYNVLMFDFRAHGRSAGQLTTYGDLERRDVLGAVRWLKANHADRCQRVVGVGSSLGAAALIAAAADPSPEGQSIEAVVAIGGYTDLPTLARDVASSRFTPMLRWLLLNAAMPLASAQTGTNLSGFSPAKLEDQLWPRPLLVIHDQQDPIVSFDHGLALFERAAQPKYYFWLDRREMGRRAPERLLSFVVAEFFRVAEARPVI